MKTYSIIIFLLLISISILPSCKKYLEIEAPKNSLIQANVFKDDASATAAVLGLYSQINEQGYASGYYTSISTLAGLSSDELIAQSVTTKEFYENQITTSNFLLDNFLWGAMYKNIYAANAVLEGLSVENGVSDEVKSQLKGEALFMRAFDYFYLVNLFGAVPLNLTTDYKVTSVAPRMSTVAVYQQIILDLKNAEELLDENYVTIERVRINKTAAQALLARTYLYLKDWANADTYANIIISKTAAYSLVALDSIFLKNSKEAIWQLLPSVGELNTRDGSFLILIAPPTLVSLNPEFAVSAFEQNDKRQTSWVNSFTDQSDTFYYPFKYKIRNSTTSSEYSVIFRLAEQYLIRSEARANLNNLAGAIDDLDILRNRAGLPLIKNVNPAISKSDLLNAILKERKIELFSEWGHRWFDLKRTNKATETLSPIKPNWQSTDVLYPIPQAEVYANINVIQNDGY